MEAIDAKDIQAFNDLQKRVISNSEQQKLAFNQESSASQAVRKAVLTAAELEKLQDNANTYSAAGKAFFLVPRKQLLAELETAAKVNSTELKRLKEVKQGLQQGMKALENDIKELLTNSPGLAQAFAAQP